MALKARPTVQRISISQLTTIAVLYKTLRELRYTPRMANSACALLGFASSRPSPFPLAWIIERYRGKA